MRRLDRNARESRLHRKKLEVFLSARGHRRVALALFKKHQPGKRRPWDPLEALLQIDMDTSQGGERGLREYMRMFKRSGTWCKERLGEFRSHRAALGSNRRANPERTVSEQETLAFSGSSGKPANDQRTPLTTNRKAKEQTLRSSPSAQSSEFGEAAPPWKPLRNLRPKDASDLDWERFLRDNFQLIGDWRASQSPSVSWASAARRFWSQKKAQRKPWQSETGEQIQARALAIVEREEAAAKERDHVR